MLPQVRWFCFIFPWVSSYRIDEIKDVSALRKYASGHQCDNDAPFTEFKPYGEIMCFSKCLQLVSCSHVKFHAKELICRASKAVSSGKPKNSKSDGSWICWKKTNLVPCPECPQQCACVTSRTGQRKCVPYGHQETVQTPASMSSQTEKVTKLFSTTAQELNGKWTTAEGEHSLRALTWSPLCSDEFYSLERFWYRNTIELYRLHGNTLEKQSRRPVQNVDSFNAKMMETGRCLTDDSMNCIHLFGKVWHDAKYFMHVKSYRLISPRHLVVERQEDITQDIPFSTYPSCIFVCNLKFGLTLYLPQGARSAMKKYSIQAGESASSLHEAGEVGGLKNILHIKWNNDGSFAFAMSATTLYLINDKEQVLIEVQHEWSGVFVPVCTNTSILVFTKNDDQIHVLKF